MQRPDTHDEMERALMRLMPVGLSQGAQTEIEAQIDELAVEGSLVRRNFPRAIRWVVSAGIAAALALGFSALPIGGSKISPVGGQASSSVEEDTGLVLLTASDRVEDVSDDGLFVDAGGSAVRKLRVRVVQESSIRDEETGIVVKLTEPREEMYLVPVSTF